MSLIFTGLALITVVSYVITIALGFQTSPGSPDAIHILIGMATAILTIVTHGLVFTYLIGTGIAVRETVEGHGLDPAYQRRTAKFKARAFPFALFSMLLVIVAAAMGARADVGSGSASAHLTWAIIGLAFNLFSFPIEIKAIAGNGNLMDEVNDKVAEKLGLNP